MLDKKMTGVLCATQSLPGMAWIGCEMGKFSRKMLLPAQRPVHPIACSSLRKDKSPKQSQELICIRLAISCSPSTFFETMACAKHQYQSKYHERGLVQRNKFEHRQNDAGCFSQMVPSWKHFWIVIFRCSLGRIICQSYWWWKNSCTTWDIYNPVNNVIFTKFTISTGAGCFPSTLWTAMIHHGNHLQSPLGPQRHLHLCTKAGHG